MRQLSNLELHRLELFAQSSVEIVLLELTFTGLRKHILDATAPVRMYLKSRGIHDYEKQGLGADHKCMLKSFLIDNKMLIHSAASLYRPETKKGDPRIWFKELGHYAHPNDIIGIFEYRDNLYVVNVTRLDIDYLLSGEELNPLAEIVEEIRMGENSIANELYYMLRTIADLGPIKGDVEADTAVGRTLESMLGIPQNPSKKPDYKGIELKSFRDKPGNRKNLFTQVPDWSLSRLKSSEEILNQFGYHRGNILKLYCTVSSVVRNSQGLRLEVDERNGYLLENSDDLEIANLVVWTLEKLHHRLLEKHNETFWIAADSVFIEGKEHFLYKSAEHTKKPILAQFDLLLQQGIITVDHLIKRDPKGAIREKGPSFKIKPKALNLLFPPSTVYELL